MPMKTAVSANLSRRQLLKAAGLGTAVFSFPLSLSNVFGKDTEKPPMFKYAICNEMYGDWPLEKVFAFSAECGYKGIEIAPFTIGENVAEIPSKRRTEVRRMAERAGLEILGLHWLFAKTQGLHLTSPDVEVRRKTARYLGALARFCAELGGRIMVLGSPKQRDLAPGMKKADGMKYASEVLRSVVKELEAADVTVALEPLGSNETNFLNSAAEGVELIQLVGSPRCRLHLDCKAMALETPEKTGTGPISRNGPEGAAQKLDLSPFSHIPEIIHKYRDLLVHFHANDPNRQGPGFGKLDFVPILKTLQEIDYRGWVSVEPLDYSPGVERLARESIRYLRRCEPAAS
jgi:sugar phosphate isomerase/epimerase